MERNQAYELEQTDGHEQSADAIIVGGGIAGLAAATYLARAGRSVILFEKSSHAGGRAISDNRDGFMFNLGAHALYKKSPALEVLNELGISFTGGSPEGIKCVSGGQFSPAPVDTTTLMKTGLLSLAGKWEAARLLLKLQFADAASFAGTTVNEWLDRNVQRAEVRRVMEVSAQVLTYTDAPDRLSMELVVEQLQLSAKGKGKVLYVDGGWQTLVNALEKAARQAGVRVITGARVAAIERNGGRVTGVRLSDNSLYRAQAVLVAAGPRDLLQMLPGTDVPEFRKIAESRIPVHAACLDLGLRRLPRPENKVVMNAEHPLFLTVQSEFSRIAPEGGALVYALKYLNPDMEQDAEANERELEGWLDETQPGWKDEVIERRYMPHLVVYNALVSAAQGGMAGRPGPQVPGIENLFIAGDWVGPKGHLANAGLHSAKLAANAILAMGGTGGVAADIRAA